MCASGGKLETLPQFYEVTLIVNGRRLVLKEVLVAKNLPKDVIHQILIGQSDIRSLKMSHTFFNFEPSGNVQIPDWLNRKHFGTIWKCSC